MTHDPDYDDTPLAQTLLAWSRARAAGEMAYARDHAEVALELLRDGHEWPHTPFRRVTFMQWCERMKLLTEKGRRDDDV